jgi:membrane protease YdiL (CAAX protease family)
LRRRSSEAASCAPSAILMSVIFGAVHAANLLGGADPRATALQVISAALVGLAFVGPLVYTGNIWPLVIIHGLNNFVGYLAAGGFLNTAATSAAPTSVEWVVSLVVPLPLALYALWLVRRAGREADQVRWSGLLPQG